MATGNVADAVGYSMSTASYEKAGLRKPVPLEPEMVLIVMVLLPTTKALAGTAKVYSVLLPR